MTLNAPNETTIAVWHPPFPPGEVVAVHFDVAVPSRAATSRLRSLGGRIRAAPDDPGRPAAERG
jgi:hypothetical protein